ncbi:MAG: NUDIX hydrolase [Bacteroidota bacterium]|nr:NUDIX hydrolase [Hyphomicrobiaceae bacterium]
MSSASASQASDTKAKLPTLRPRDAATLIIVDRTAAAARVLLGKRRTDLKFMPGKYVFPGGRVDKADRYATAADDLDESEKRKLLLDMKGVPSPARARALALAAVRETYEEAGLIIGGPVADHAPPKSDAWRRFYDTGFVPKLAPLTYFARAITPPGRPRRFDTRFFCVDAASIVHRTQAPEEELSGLVWMTLEEARTLDLPPITRVILEDLADRLKSGVLHDASAAVPYYHNRNGSFKRELLQVDGAGELP